MSCGIYLAIYIISIYLSIYLYIYIYIYIFVCLSVYLSVTFGIYIAPLQGNYSEALPTQAQVKRKEEVFRRL